MSAPPHPEAARLSKQTVVLICMTIMSLGFVVWWNYYIKFSQDKMEGRLPIRSRVETDPGALVDQNGTVRNLDALRGKVIVWAYVYTTCPSGCAGLADEMKKLQDEFGKDPRFQMVSVSLYPEHDRPEMLKGWTTIKNFTGENWWFVTSKEGTEADGERVRGWMKKTFGMWAIKKSPEHIANNPADVWDHKVVFSLSDAKGNIRTPTDSLTFWDPFFKAFDSGWYPRPIAEDIKKLLEEASATP